MNALVTIMAHGEPNAIQTFYRHLHFWRAHKFPMLVMCPEDSQIPASDNLPVLAIGHRSHHDAEANRRFRMLLTILAATDYDSHVIYEYDSLCLLDVIPKDILKTRGIWGNQFEEQNPGERFTAKHYFHPPLIIDHRTLRRLVEFAPEVPDHTEFGFWDRWLGRLCEISRVALRPFGERGYSRNTIESSDLPYAEIAARRDAWFFHGIKTANVLNRIRLAHSERSFSCIEAA